MRLNFNFDIEQLVLELNQPLGEISFKRSGSAVLDVACIRNGEQIELPPGWEGVFGVKKLNQYDEPEFVTAAAATQVGIGSEAIYRFIFAAADPLIDAALNVDGDVTNDLEKVSFMAEVLFRVSGTESRSQTFTVIIVNNVIRGTEDVPGYTPTEYVYDDTDPANPSVLGGDDGQPLVYA